MLRIRARNNEISTYRILLAQVRPYNYYRYAMVYFKERLLFAVVLKCFQTTVWCSCYNIFFRTPIHTFKIFTNHYHRIFALVAFQGLNLYNWQDKYSFSTHGCFLTGYFKPNTFLRDVQGAFPPSDILLLIQNTK